MNSTLSNLFICKQQANSLELFHEGAMVGNILPETLEDSADMVPYGEFIIKLAGSTSVLNIWSEKMGEKG